jgi:hypothetical protein
MNTALPICVDDFGSEVYRCRYTDQLVWADIAFVVGATMPGVKARYVITPDARQAHRNSGIAFHDSEANCNTCRHLVRVRHAKCRSGFLRGRCAHPSPQLDASPYFNRMEGDVMVFHPDDPMHMPCYESRFSTTD